MISAGAGDWYLLSEFVFILVVYSTFTWLKITNNFTITTFNHETYVSAVTSRICCVFHRDLFCIDLNNYMQPLTFLTIFF